MNIKEYEHYGAQEHFSECKKCQRIVDKVILQALKDQRDKDFKEHFRVLEESKVMSYSQGAKRERDQIYQALKEKVGELPKFDLSKNGIDGEFYYKRDDILLLLKK